VQRILFDKALRDDKRSDSLPVGFHNQDLLLFHLCKFVFLFQHVGTCCQQATEDVILYVKRRAWALVEALVGTLISFEWSWSISSRRFQVNVLLHHLQSRVVNLAGMVDV